MVQFADGVVTFWAGLPARLVLVWPDAEHLAMGRLLFRTILFHGPGQLALTRDASRSGRRHVERMLARMCREAGARVKFNALFRDMNVGVHATDDWKIGVLAQDLPCFDGAQLAIDAAELSWNGEARPHAAEVDGSSAASKNRQRDPVSRAHDGAMPACRGGN